MRVFTYGSNMCLGRLLAYDVHPQAPGLPAILRDHRLCFDKKSKDKSGKANVVPAIGGEVWGVLYQILNEDLVSLDKGEGGYVRQMRTVQTVEGLAVDAWVYLAEKPSHELLRPYSWYKRFILEGAVQHGLPEQYIASIRTIEAVEDPDRERDSRMRKLTCR